jgi:hypothetical protein
MTPPEKPRNDERSAREAKLAQALRANLRRRKAGDGVGKADAGPPKTVDKP